ncbi:MAG: WecB/TagA/CpsF family glycosyltransferase [Candidatus Melainabacteria bacterium]|nr:WecB/TagA/CpsF family glycosyltransferase [Candidatus Melainabacteria bacterium]
MSTLSATNRARQQVLGYPVDIVDELTALEVFEAAWHQGKGLQVITLNAEMVVAAQQDQELDRIVRHAHLIIPDGAGVVWALRLSGQAIDRVPGIDLAQAALKRASTAGRKVTLIGGRPEVLSALERLLPKVYPGLLIAGINHGYFSPSEEESMVERLAEGKPDLVLVALGVPKQEYFIDRWHTFFPRAIMMGVGGSFDIWSGASTRAPAIMQKFHLEWLYRLMKEPWRWRRMGSALPKFSFQVIQDFLRKPSKKSFKNSRNK